MLYHSFPSMTTRGVFQNPAAALACMAAVRELPGTVRCLLAWHMFRIVIFTPFYLF